MELDGGLALPGQDRQGDSLTSRLQLFEQVDDLLEFWLHFQTRYLNLKIWQELTKTRPSTFTSLATCDDA